MEFNRPPSMLSVPSACNTMSAVVFVLLSVSFSSNSIHFTPPIADAFSLSSMYSGSNLSTCSSYSSSPRKKRKRTPHRSRLFFDEKFDSSDNNKQGTSNTEYICKTQQNKLTTISGAREWFMKSIGVDPTPDVVAIATIYFVEGALGLARLAQTFLLKDELHLGPAELSALSGIFTLPWTIKPIYGFLSDGLPLFGYRRRSYLVLAGLLGCFSYSAVGNNFWGLIQDGGGDSVSISYYIAALVISSACIAVSDVVADGIVVQKTRDAANAGDPNIAGGLQSLCWGSAAIGGLLSAYFSGSLLEVMKPQDVFQLTAILPFLVASIALLINEKPTSTSVTSPPSEYSGNENVVDVWTQVDALWNAIKQPSIYKPALFIFLWQSTPTSEGAMLFFMTEDLGFGPEFLGRVRFVAAFSSLFGVWLYNTYLKTKSIKDILFWSSILSFPLGLLDLVLISHSNRSIGIPDNWFVFGDDVVLSVLGEIAFLPTLVLAARLCPVGVEAVLFATLMSINNGAGTIGSEVGAVLTKALGVTETNFDNLILLSFICNLTSLYPLLFIGWLDEVGSISEKEIEEQQKSLATAGSGDTASSSSSATTKRIDVSDTTVSISSDNKA